MIPRFPNLCAVIIDIEARSIELSSRIALGYRAVLACAVMAAVITASRTAAAGEGGPSDATDLADQWLVAAIEKAESWKSVKAELRMRVSMFDANLIGTGSYASSGSGLAPYRMDLRFGIGDQFSTKREICDGSALWVFREAEGKPSLTRVDLDQVRRALTAARGEGLSGSTLAGWLGLGGVPRLLRSIHQSFAMQTISETPTATQPLVRLEGRWREGAWEKLTSGDDGNATPKDEQVPTSVVVFLGRQDLFPYRLEFVGPRRSGAEDQSGNSRVFLQIEFFEVAVDGSVDARQFEFRPGGMEYRDGTGDFLQQHRLRVPEEGGSRAAEARARPDGSGR